jgi:LPS O-antigen subunit length determinant protein (WzzB/FepE family)
MPQIRKQSEYHSNDIGLIDLIILAWQGRWAIIFFIAIALLIVLLFIFSPLNKTEISFQLKPITSFSFEKYAELNSIGFFNVNRSSLVDLFSERLQERDHLVASIKKHKLIDRDQYKSDEAYDEAVVRAAFKFDIAPPSQSDSPNGQEENQNQYWSIKYSGVDKVKILSVLDDTFLAVTENVRQVLKRRFMQKVRLSEQKVLHSIENIERSIRDLKSDFNIKVENKLEFLQEQAQIARALNIKSSLTAEARSLFDGGLVLAGLSPDPLCYLRGYVAIEKEISLLKNRESNDPFMSDLLKLEAKKRSILKDPSLDRVRQAFHKSPIENPAIFKAVQDNLAAAEVSYKINPVFIISLSMILGGVIGFLWLLIGSVLQGVIPPKNNGAQK